MTAECLSCVEGVTLEEYCKVSSNIGCDLPRACCRAMTVKCLSCS
jgi:hypothetical protein